MLLAVAIPLPCNVQCDAMSASIALYRWAEPQPGLGDAPPAFRLAARPTAHAPLQLRKAGSVEAKPLPAAKTKKHTKRFGYRLHPKQQQAQQRQQQAA